MPYPPAGALPLALVASPFISPAPNFSGPAISPIDANEPVGSQGATLSYTAATEAEHVKLTARNNRTLLKPTKRVPCRTFSGAQWCGVEWDEWTMATAVLHPSDAIVEFGGRWGTTSCMLASITQNSGRVVAVEPDTAAHGPLLRNRASHNANFHVLKGTVSEQPLTLSAHLGYGTRTSSLSDRKAIRRAAKGDSTDQAVRVLPNVQVEEVEKALGGPITAVLIDCEGCIGSVVSHERLMRSVELVLMEQDYIECTDYGHWHAELRRMGFRRVWHAADSFCSADASTCGIYHSAWERRRPQEKRRASWRCEAYKRHMGYTDEQLRCADDLSETPPKPKPHLCAQVG